MQDKVIHELLRDLVGTAKAGGNTDEIVAAIEERVAKYEDAIEEYGQDLDYNNQCLMELVAKMHSIEKKLHIKGGN